MASVEVLYGKGSLRLAVPEGLVRPECFLHARSPAAGDERRLLAEAVARAAWRVRDPVAVVLPDETRPLDRAAALDALRGVLADRRVEVVVGGGLHPATPLASSPWPARVHDARDADLVRLGRAGGVEVAIDGGVARAATRIVVGVVQPHYLAGFGGGPKALVPGVAAQETILAVHRRADVARPGRLAGNPFAGLLRECAALVPAPTFFLHLLVGPRGPFAALTGDHAEAVARYHEACALELPAPADVVVADAGGHPADATLLQAHKAYEAAAGLARTGARIVLVAACDAGYGHPEFRRRLFAPEGGPFHPYARTARAWHAKARAHPTRFVTELDVSGLGVERGDAARALRDVPAGARVLWARRAQDLLFRK